MSDATREGFDWSDTNPRTADLTRVLAMDAVEQAGSGHPGPAMSLAPAACLLFQKVQLAFSATKLLEADCVQARVGVKAGLARCWRHFVSDAGSKRQPGTFRGISGLQQAVQELGITADRVAVAATGSLEAAGER